MKITAFKSWTTLCAIIYVLIGLSAVQAETAKGDQTLAVSAGKKVSFEYTLKLEDKSVVDTNVGGEPLTYLHGSGQIIPGLEKQLEGMKVGDRKNVKVSPAEGYGEVNEKAVMEVDKTRVPQDALKVGARLQGQDDNGQPVFATVKEIKEKSVVLDHNHPLAGKTLYFDVKILNIE